MRYESVRHAGDVTVRRVKATTPKRRPAGLTPEARASLVLCALMLGACGQVQRPATPELEATPPPPPANAKSPGILVMHSYRLKEDVAVYVTYLTYDGTPIETARPTRGAHRIMASFAMVHTGDSQPPEGAEMLGLEKVLVFPDEPDGTRIWLRIEDTGTGPDRQRFRMGLELRPPLYGSRSPDAKAMDVDEKGGSPAPAKKVLSKLDFEVLYKVAPKLPDRLKAAGNRLEILTKVCVETDGSVGSVTVVRRAHPLADAAVVEALHRRRYRMPWIDGKLVPVCHPVNVTFNVS